MNEQTPLEIKSGQGDYTVRFPDSLDNLVTGLSSLPEYVVLIDRNIDLLYGRSLARLIAGRPVYKIDATEEEKTPDGIQRVLEFLQANNVTKQTRLVVVGGGIVQDIGTFVAHIYYRGLQWHYVPTTLLGMADSCIGAKCGINLGPFKNQIGVFHSPSSVWICRSFLETLKDVDIRSGYGEIVKLHLTRSSSQLFFELSEEIEGCGLRTPRLADFIRKSLEVKKGVIEEDEYEKDLRRILNYGHTFGHALESITHHAVPHGIAVAWGMDLVNYISFKSGMLAEADFKVIHHFIDKHFTWKIPRSIAVDDLIAASRRDKKVADGRINLVLADRPGSLKIVSRAFDLSLETAVSEYLEKYNVLHCD